MQTSRMWNPASCSTFCQTCACMHWRWLDLPLMQGGNPCDGSETRTRSSSICCLGSRRLATGALSHRLLVALAAPRHHSGRCWPPAGACHAMATSAPSAVAASGAPPQITYLTQAQAIAIDEALMGPLGFSVDQLMELAGLSVASAFAEQYPLAHNFRRVLVIAGPGNNGGDGLVAARHLHHFGYDVQVCYPKPTDKPLYNGLVTQAKSLGLSMPQWSDIKAGGPLSSQYDAVIDAIFGFSFKGSPRAPFDEILTALTAAQSPPPILSVDIPSGWDVEKGPNNSGTAPCIQPDTLVSLTAPKLCARHFKGAHFLGGRFVPPAIKQQYSLVLPPYPGASQHVRLPFDAADIGSNGTGVQAASSQGQQQPSSSSPSAGTVTSPSGITSSVQELGAKVADMRITYTKGGLEESDFDQYGGDPMKAWADWFAQATEGKVCEEPNAISLASVDPGTLQPSVRVVLLKGFDSRGFVFYTNYNSRKGRALEGTGKAAFTVYWEKLQRQVRVEGQVERVPDEESTEYYHSRPRGSQVGAWVSNQSQPIAGRHELEARNSELAAQYADESVPVPRPPHWGGYLIRPTTIEFWQGRPSRLHDRIVFTRSTTSSNDWQMKRLQP